MPFVRLPFLPLFLYSFLEKMLASPVTEGISRFASSVSFCINLQPSYRIDFDTYAASI